MTPDGQFPNVTKTPNPEVPESMDRAAVLAEAARRRPRPRHRPRRRPPRRDGPGPATATGTLITGNEIAALLTHFKLSKLAAAGPAAAVADRGAHGGDDEPGHAHRPPFQGPGHRQPAGRLQVHRRRAVAAGAERRLRGRARHAGRLRDRRRGEPRHPGRRRKSATRTRAARRCCWRNWPWTRSARARRCSITSNALAQRVRLFPQRRRAACS